MISDFPASDFFPILCKILDILYLETANKYSNGVIKFCIFLYMVTNEFYDDYKKSFLLYLPEFQFRSCSLYLVS